MSPRGCPFTCPPTPPPPPPPRPHPQSSGRRRPASRDEVLHHLRKQSRADSRVARSLAVTFQILRSRRDKNSRHRVQPYIMPDSLTGTSQTPGHKTSAAADARLSLRYPNRHGTRAVGRSTACTASE